jgi:hypothetical protein
MRMKIKKKSTEHESASSLNNFLRIMHIYMTFVSSEHAIPASRILIVWSNEIEYNQRIWYQLIALEIFPYSSGELDLQWRTEPFVVVFVHKEF